MCVQGYYHLHGDRGNGAALLIFLIHGTSSSFLSPSPFIKGVSIVSAMKGEGTRPPVGEWTPLCHAAGWRGPTALGNNFTALIHTMCCPYDWECGFAGVKRNVQKPCAGMNSSGQEKKENEGETDGGRKRLMPWVSRRARGCGVVPCGPEGAGRSLPGAARGCPRRRSPNTRAKMRNTIKLLGPTAGPREDVRQDSRCPGAAG